MKQRNAFEPILWSSCLAMFAVGANSTAIMAALPSMTTELSLSSAGVEWAVNSYLVVSASFIVLGGQAADRLAHGRCRWPDWRCSRLAHAASPPPGQKLLCSPDARCRALRQHSQCPAPWLGLTPTLRQHVRRQRSALGLPS